MTETLGWLFSSAGFMPHGHCYLWQPATLWLNVGSDGLIAAAYYAIPFALYYFVRERRAEIPYPWILLMFAAFILLCGTTHILEIWTVWKPAYRLEGGVKLLTGLVSLATMLALFRVMPKAMLLRSPSQLQREVDTRTAELAEVNTKLREEIAARDAAQAQLRDQDRRKDEFLAILAHELRNPLAPIRHAVKLLGLDTASVEQQIWGRDVIARQAQRMALLLDDLLDVSRITRGRLELKKERVDLAQLVNAAVDTVRPSIEDKRHVLTVDVPAGAITIDGDPLRLSQAVSNLLTNAAKFTPPGGQIDLSVIASAEELRITVSDTGTGFDPQMAPMLFEMFSQVGAGAGGTEGLGIGLALVKGLIELHGGSVTGRSHGKGLGSEFVIRLPGPVHFAPAIAPQSDPQPDPRAPYRATVLLADDNRDAAETMGLLLELSGFEVILAHSGHQALELGRRHLPSIVILDIGMPDMSGYDVARTARQEVWGERVLLLAVTGWGQPDDRATARSAGFDHHLTKPVDPDALEKLLTAYLISKRETDPS